MRPLWFLAVFTGMAAAPIVQAATFSVGEIDSLRSPAGDGSGEPSLSVAPDGTVWMSWIQGPSARVSIITESPRKKEPQHSLMTSRISGGRWLNPVPIIRSDDLFANWADPPVLAAMGREVAWIGYPWKRPGVGYAYDLRASFTSNGGVLWTKPVTLNRDGKPAQHGFVSLAPSGEGVEIVWLDGRKTRKPKPGREAEGDMTVRAARLDAGGTLMREVEIDARACDCCNTAVVAVPGGILAAYRDRDKQETRDIVLTRLEEGTWSAPTPLHRDGWKIDGCPVNGPALDTKETRVVAAWFTMEGNQPKVKVAFSADGGVRFGAPIPVSSNDPLGRVDVALTADGSALVSWLDALGQDALFRVQRIPVSGPAPEPVTVARVSASRSSGFPKMVVSGDHAYFAWVDAMSDGHWRGWGVRTATARIP